MKKKSLRSLRLNKKIISNFKNHSFIGGAANLTVDVNDCPDNTLAIGCKTLGACPPPEPSASDLFIECCLVL